MKTIIFIPARYHSSRFPGKPLADILGRPMIEHVYEKASMSKKADEIIVATDDLRIYSAVKAFGGNVVMTSRKHESGTDRITEAIEKVTGDIFINLQGDEPLINPRDIDVLIEKMLSDTSCNIATLCHPVAKEEALNPNTVKVVRAANGKALYFSRSLIPYRAEGATPVTYYKHVGIYGYRRHILAAYKCLPYSTLENQERLEQLRLIEAGYSIDVLKTDRTDSYGVDTPADLEIVKRILREKKFDSLSVMEHIHS